ncbi:MAG: T9SS type A sorting domain-containing protein [Bacteroidota bacterium]
MKKHLYLLVWAALLLICTPSTTTAQYLHWGTNLTGPPTSLTVEGQKNLYVSGSGLSLAYITQFDSAGYQLWNRGFKSSFTSVSISDIQLDGQGGMYVLGNFNTQVILNHFTPQADTLSGLGGNDIFLAHFDAIGQTIWAFVLGGSGDDGASQLVRDAAGNLYLSGSFTSSVDFDPGPTSTTLSSAGQTDLFVASYDVNGDFRWAKSAGGFGIDWSAGIGVHDSIVYVGGTITGTGDFDPIDSLSTINAFGTDAFIAAYDTLGQFHWVKGMGGMARDIARKFLIDASGYLYLAGDFEGPADFDPSDSTYQLTPVGESDIFFAKYSPEGEFLLAGSVGGPDYDRGWGMSVDNQERIYLMGQFGNQIDVDPGDSTVMLNGTGMDNMFFSIYDSLGDFQWVHSLEAAPSSRFIVPDDDGNFYVGGTFFYGDSMYIDPMGGPAALIRTSSENAFLIKYAFYPKTYIATSLEPHDDEPGWHLFPNPAQDFLNVKVSGQNILKRVRLLDIQGRLLIEKAAESGQQISFAVGHLAKGMYMVQLEDQSGKRYSRRFIKSE